MVLTLFLAKKLYKNALSKIINEYASGDDIFLLQYAKSIKAKILFLKNKDAIVYTNPVHSLKSFVFQRVRWASKSKGYKDKFTLVVAWIVFLTSTVSALYSHPIFPFKRHLLYSNGYVLYLKL